MSKSVDDILYSIRTQVLELQKIDTMIKNAPPPAVILIADNIGAPYSELLQDLVDIRAELSRGIMSDVVELFMTLNMSVEWSMLRLALDMMYESTSKYGGNPYE